MTMKITTTIIKTAPTVTETIKMIPPYASLSDDLLSKGKGKTSRNCCKHLIRHSNKTIRHMLNHTVQYVSNVNNLPEVK